MIQFRIVTPERTVLEEEIYQATLPVEGGEVTLLSSHLPFIGSLRAGEIMVRRTIGGEEINFATSGGFVEFHNNTMIILADTAERADEIDLVRAEEARERAKNLQKEAITMSEEEYALISASIEKEMARVRVAKKHHSRRGITIEDNSI